MAGSQASFRALVAQAEAFLAAGDRLAAKKHFESALPFAEEQWGPNSLELVPILQQLARIAHQISWDSPESLTVQIELLERAVRICQSAPRYPTIETAHLLGTLGTVLRAAGRLDEAAQRLHEALRLLADHDYVSRRYLQIGLVDVLIGKGRFAEALAVAEELLDLAGRPPSQPVIEFVAWYGLGRSLLGLHRPSEAVQYMERCLEYQLSKHGDSANTQEIRQLLEVAKEGASSSAPESEHREHRDRQDGEGSTS